MKRFVRKFIPQKIINNFRHKPTALVANLKFGFPSKGLTVVGVTGTDGKTTTVNMLYQILKAAGRKVSMISTINAVIGDKELDTGFHVTSPDPFLVQKLIKQAKDAGSEIMVLEVTSHGLDQNRFLGIKFDIGIVTNITHEHLDYHKTWENYFWAKAKLIRNVKFAVLNHDEKHFSRLSKLTKGKVVSFGLTKNANFNPFKFPLNLKLPGEFNILNAMAASAAAVNLGVDSKIIKKALEEFESLSGRMEEIENDLGVKIFVDFAHTPNALENALKTLRGSSRFRSNSIIAVFGCAGLRDVEKRALMGEVATRLADKVVITAEDPRGMVNEINGQIMEGVEKAGGKLGENIFVENDRQKAIEFAVRDLAKKGDVVGIFGKGHETSMNLDGKTELPWSDKEAVKRVLSGSKDSDESKESKV